MDVERIRSHFPALAEGAAHFDGAGGTQTADVVGDAVRDTMLSAISNRSTFTRAEQRAEQVVAQTRGALADLLDADPGGVVFGRSMTALTFEFSRALAKTWRPGDEVVLSRLDHDANVRPWVIAAENAGATVRWIDFDPETGELEDVSAHLGERTRLVAVTGASNLIGTRPALRPIADAVHAAGALFYVDAVHLAAHAPVSLAEFGADFLACSPYKFFGPHCGVVAAAPELLAELHPDKLAPSSDAVPERFELGTLPYELMAGVTAAIDFLAGLEPEATGSRRERIVTSMTAAAAHEDALRAKIEAGLAELNALSPLTVWSRAAERTPTLLVTFAEHEAADAYPFLAERGVNAPAGSFYAYETARRLGLGAAGGLRFGLSAYNNDEDVDRLLAGLREFLSR
ncbi:cysteine desulfurase-like protein [Kineosporia rhizophila]|uniref:cysteine desulfurase-like protein n=1 Tax=Kineosporia TaxID=49184 RepID=UPI001E2ED156|nr:cysteine desulfurase-like protein [Kineosporia sp. NBRC 101677]MCE0534985.1 cysteine desulfurase-like protein [Kineosporia rhizophila]GLY14732.1 cysteine desulfurase-like protein [Kineosporia sp. NBRC 101677]